MPLEMGRCESCFWCLEEVKLGWMQMPLPPPQYCILCHPVLGIFIGHKQTQGLQEASGHILSYLSSSSDQRPRCRTVRNCRC